MKRWILLLGLLGLAGCSEQSPWDFQGYVEGDTLYLGAPVAGTLQALAVDRGQTIEAGSELFTLDGAPEKAAVEEARARVDSAESELADLRKGQRPAELEMLEAQWKQARASLELSQRQLKRLQRLFQQGAVSQAELDDAETRVERDQQQVRQLAAQREVANMGAREDRIQATQAQVEAARAHLAQLQWQLEQNRQVAPEAGQVKDVLFRPGEFVPAGRPVVALLPPNRVRIPFFVDEPMLGQLQVGQQVLVRCDGCGEPFPARITFINPRADYTPPFIYSKENRSKFVFRVEARPTPDKAGRLHPGQPVDVRLPEGS
ncbi:HlyD family efflux transporter periplasmic adaptor subunit [Marinobacteraceae bacterium S3BR75-40.1]